jgi:membrane-bound serine protease (ClpP class)
VRRLSTIGLAAAILVLGVTLLAATPRAAAAGTPERDDAGTIDVVKVSGLLDPVLVDFVEQSVHTAETDHAVALVLQLNSSGAVVSDGRIRALAQTLHDAKVPIAIWVGPSGAKARGAAAQLLGVVDSVGVAPGSRVGDTGDLIVDRSLLRPEFTAQLDQLHGRTVDSTQASKTGVADIDAPVIGDLVIKLPGVKTQVVKTDQGPRTQPLTSPVFRSLPITSELMHTVASPSAAYVLFVAGLALILFEMFTAGVGIAGLVGAVCLVLGCYGLAVLPATWYGIALLAAAFLAGAVDVQVGVPRWWSGIALVLLVAGSFLLYHGVAVGWLSLLIVVVAMAVYFFAAMPAMVRTRFSTPTIDRAWLVGQSGLVAGDSVVGSSQQGEVFVHGARWPARTGASAGLLEAGAEVLVSGVSGLVLLVEPVATHSR